jgi:hypothetical protein
MREVRVMLEVPIDRWRLLEGSAATGALGALAMPTAASAVEDRSCFRA